MVDGVKSFTALRISASGLSVQRARMDVFAENIANASTTRTEDGGPYRRKVVTIGATSSDGTRLPAVESELALARTHVRHGDGGGGPVPGESPAPGVEVAAIETDDSEGPLIYDPTHPDANEEGYVRMPNVEIITELLSLQGAARAYEANLAAMKAEQEAARETLRIGT